jgi:hypothetical protein
MNDLRAFRLVAAAALVGWSYASAYVPAVAAQPSAPARGGNSVDVPGRQASKQNCPSLVDGRGDRVRSRGTGGAAESTFAKECPPVVARPVPPAPAPQHKALEPAQGIRGLAAGTVQADLDPAEDFDGAPLVVRVTPERMSASVLTGGTTLWLLHSSFWTYLLILGLPLWRHVDLLPIVDSARHQDEPRAEPAAGGADEERAVARVLQARGRPRANREGS